MAQNWSLSRSLLFLSQKSSAVTLNSVQSSMSLCRVTLYIIIIIIIIIIMLFVEVTWFQQLLPNPPS